MLVTKNPFGRMIPIHCEKGGFETRPYGRLDEITFLIDNPNI
jgi:hypothetical protein